IAPQIKKLMGPFGDAVPIPAPANQLELTDSIGNLRRIRETIKQIEGEDRIGSETWTHQCKFVKAREAERILKELLGDPAKVAAATAQAQQPQRGGGRDGFGGRGGFDGFGGRGGLDGGMAAAAPAPVTPRVRMHYITSDEKNNTVFVSGP